MAQVNLSIYTAGDKVSQNTAVDISALQNGEFPLLQDVRVNKRTLQVRMKEKLIADAPVAGTYLGHYVGTILGGSLILLALGVSGEGRVYQLQYYAGVATWTEWTTDGAGNGGGFAAASKEATYGFGDTRFSSATDLITFTKVTALTTTGLKELIVAVNGNDTPRVGPGYLVTQTTLSYPTVGAYTFTPTFPKFFLVSGTTAHTFTSTGKGGAAQVHLVASDDSGLNDRRLKMVATNTVVPQSTSLTGTITTSTSVTSVTATGTEGYGNSFFNGCTMTITSGTYAGESAMISAYVSATGVFTLQAPGFANNPGTVNFVITGITGIYGDNTIVQFASPVDLTNEYPSTGGSNLSLRCPYLVFRVDETTGADIMPALRIDVSPDKTNWYTVYDPSSVTYLAPLTVADVETGQKYYSYDLTHITVNNLSAVAYIRFVFVGAVPAAGETAYINLIAGSGWVQGGTDVAISFENDQTLAESPQISLAITNMPRLADLGGGSSTNTHVDLLLDSPYLFYEYSLSVANPNSGAATDTIGPWPTQINIWWRAVSTVPYSFYGFASTYVWNGALSTNGQWANSQTTAQFSFPMGLYSITDPYFQDYYTGPLGYLHNTPAPNEFRIAPDPYPDLYTIPQANMIMGNNYRLFVAEGSTVWFSDDQYPFRFRAAQRSANGVPDDTSGNTVTYDTQISGLGRLPGATVNGSAIIVFTPGFTWVQDGVATANLSTPALLVDHGCGIPGTVATRGQEMYWIDEESQLRMVGSDGTAIPSQYRVDAEIAAGLPVSGCFFNQRYYLVFQKSGSATANTILVYDQAMQAWTEDSFDFTVAGLANYSGYSKINSPWPYHGVNTAPVLLMFDSSGNAYFHEYTDGSVAFSLKTPIYRNGDDALSLDDVQIQCDAAVASFDVIRTWYPSGEVVPSTSMDLVSASPQTWATTKQGYTGRGGYGVSLEISGSAPAGFQIYRLRAFGDKREMRATR